MATGWNDGLCQDYDKGLGRWFADRLGARQQLRRDFEMTQQHITQEQATQIAAQFAEDATYEFNIANAAIKHYIDQCADAELHTKQVERGLDKATAQLAEIAATEPVGYAVPTFNFDNSVIKPVHYAGTVPLFTRPMPADVTELVEALEKLASLGNGDQYGNSDGNMIARDALAKFKGAK